MPLSTGSSGYEGKGGDYVGVAGVVDVGLRDDVDLVVAVGKDAAGRAVAVDKFPWRSQKKRGTASGVDVGFD